MDIMELGAIGDLVGGVAVIGSLIYLGLQVRQSNTLAITRSHEESSRASSDLAFFYADASTTDLFMRARENWSALSAHDILRMRYLLQAAMNYFETLYYANHRGEVHPEVWQSRITRIRAYRAVGLPELWRELGPLFGDSFRGFIEREVLSNAGDDSRSPQGRD